MKYRAEIDGLRALAVLPVISFHLGVNRSNKGGPPGFWEVLNNEQSTGFIILTLYHGKFLSPCKIF